MEHPRRLSDGETARPRVVLWLLATLVVVALGAALHATRTVSVMLAYALFAALLLAPVSGAVSRRVPPRWHWLGVLAAMVVFLLAVFVFAAGVAFALVRAGAELTAVSGGAGGDIVENLFGSQGDGAPGGVAADEGTVGTLLSGLNLDLRTLAERLAGAAGGIATNIATTATAALGGMVIVFFLTLLALADAPSWSERLSRPPFAGARAAVLGTMATTGRHVRRYVLIRLVVGIATAALYVAWLWVFGVGLLWTWAVLTVLLGFIPNIGSVISGTLPTLYAFLTKDVGTAIAVGAGLLVIEQAMGNFVDPKLQGRNVRIAPTVILVSLLVWTWVWGVAGTLVAVPATILMICVFARVESLRPFAFMLSDCDDWDEFDRMTAPPGPAT